MSARLALVLIGGLVSVVATGVSLAASGYTFIRNFHGMVTNGGVMCMTAQTGVIDSRTGRPVQGGSCAAVKNRMCQHRPSSSVPTS
jgi:hypothetical protein